jgi:putative addiction module antidote
MPWNDLPLTISVKVVKVGNSLRMTIPREVTTALGIKAGDMLEVGLDDHSIIVKKSAR